ncbi:MAG TPA: 3'(2'),5'-bisphosphate nucleotidase CysQ [Streptosporangiaceae bacterium]|nr:3'(2'),5'-bisphosphate nucleotidase CysQ [Streptosporangiaceae bacterium]
MTSNGSDHDLARDLAESAGRRLMNLRADASLGDDLRKLGDRSAHEFLAGELARRRPDDAILSEEGKDNPARLSATRVWIVDPLDGTREFGEAGRADWAVHVALWERGELAAGAVALPAQGIVLSTADYPARPAGTAPFPTEVPAGTCPVELPAGLRILVSRSRPPAFVQQLAADTGAQLVPMGSAGAKAAAVIRGEYDAYIHAGGQYEWDSAAPVAVARAAGLHASRIDGSALEYNQANVSVPDILISPARLAPGLLTAIANAAAEPAPPQRHPSMPSDPELRP